LIFDPGKGCIHITVGTVDFQVSSTWPFVNEAFDLIDGRMIRRSSHTLLSHFAVSKVVLRTFSTLPDIMGIYRE
jgi:hypothetical protein